MYTHFIYRKLIYKYYIYIYIWWYNIYMEWNGLFLPPLGGLRPHVRGCVRAPLFSMLYACIRGSMRLGWLFIKVCKHIYKYTQYNQLLVLKSLSSAATRIMRTWMELLTLIFWPLVSIVRSCIWRKFHILSIVIIADFLRGRPTLLY